ncbi:telomere zinc finger-associated protein [Diorhabda carinulata]|uniref:telomere zinc finger-associated protein n=1 Tax=Diorhabda carinulata TaxID=1163345 RepID=UPI0025A01454|nr:telomere zinc finger-associated protein [Diorhabda carinulata]
MYSFYRTWLSLGPCGGIPTFHTTMPAATPLNLSTSANLPGIPDVSLQVGPNLTQFSAHKVVLATHSGFFKAAIANQHGSSPLLVPNVNVDEFSSLLTFMYTGYLDLNIGNIYNILLATHILHMPRALEICRSFLLQSQPPEMRTNIIKPIPSRKAALPSQEIYPPMYSALHKSEDTPFKEVNSKEQVIEQKASTSKSEDIVNDMELKPLSPPKRASSDKHKHKKRQGTSNEKVIIDIACCDGPVKFHRVINKNYGMIPTGDNYERAEVNQNEVLNKVMNENIRDSLDEEAENQNNEVFTCVYCNHTFKSQYCYQKHARRHLNPISIEPKAIPKESKREVKLLDMNVQYYPCKTCGSKFPSYYFVHKHRKLCHAEEMADNNNKNNEMVPENVENTDSSCSAIDVEAVNSEK